MVTCFGEKARYLGRQMYVHKLSCTPVVSSFVLLYQVLLYDAACKDYHRLKIYRTHSWSLWADNFQNDTLTNGTLAAWQTNTHIYMQP